MLIRLSYGAVALFATTALTHPGMALAQAADSQAGATEQAAPEEEDRVLGPVVVRGAFIPDEKRETSEVASLVDSEDFSLRGDSDVAAALRRVTGISIDTGGKFVYVRGLNERYTASTLNGSTIPSPEPLRKVAPLDLFPTSILQSTLVQKTFSPEMSGEFGGGMIDIRTVAVPTENFFEVGASVGGNTEATFQDGLLHDGGDTDYLGYDDGVRDLPAGLDQVFADGTFGQLDPTEANAFSRALTTDPRLNVVQEGITHPDFGVDATGGRRIDINQDLSVGVIGSVSYSNDWSTKAGARGTNEAVFNSEAGDFENIVQLFDGERKTFTNTVELNAFGSVGIDIFDNHELKFVAFGTRSTDKKTEQEEGDTNDEDDVLFERLEWVERELWTTQVQGEHVFPALMDLEIDWRGSYSEATRDAPYNVFTSYEPLTVNLPDVKRVVQGSGVEFSEIADDSTDFAIDGLLPLLIGDIEVDLKAGYAYTEKDREAESNFLGLGANVLSPGVRVDAAFAEFFADGTQSLDATRSASSPAFYQATQEIDAGYAGFDAQLTPFLRIALGARYEDFIQVVETRSARNRPGVITPPLEESSWLPAATVTWNFADNLQLRVGYSETVNRPQFREVGPSQFTNTETNERFIGNPFLEVTDITNYDARLEWYFGRDQFVTLGAFYKELENPIEQVNIGQGESRLISFVNIKAAEVQGLELEYQQAIPLADWVNWQALDGRDYSVTFNYTYSDSEIDASDPIQILDATAIPNLASLVSGVTDTTLLLALARDSNGNLVVGPAGVDPDDPQYTSALSERNSDFEEGRQLQGLSENLANLQIGYRDEEARADLNLVLNFQDERIRSVESRSNDAPAIIEQPPTTLDLVYRKDFTALNGEYQFGFEVENLLGEQYEAFQEVGGEREFVETYDIGTSVSVSLKRFF